MGCHILGHFSAVTVETKLKLMRFRELNGLLINKFSQDSSLLKWEELGSPHFIKDT